MDQTSLQVINHDLETISGFISQLLGAEYTGELTEAPQKVAAMENVLALKDLKKKVQEYFKPIKEEAKKPYDGVLIKEKAWLSAIEKPLEILDKAISIYNQRERERINEQRQKAADEQARENGQEFAEKVPDTLIVSKAESSTASESETIDEIKILDHATLARALMDTGKESMIVLDKKTETAIKKWLIQNPAVTEFPGLYFVRGIKNIIRKR